MKLIHVGLLLSLLLCIIKDMEALIKEKDMLHQEKEALEGEKLSLSKTVATLKKDLRERDNQVNITLGLHHQSI